MTSTADARALDEALAALEAAADDVRLGLATPRRDDDAALRDRLVREVAAHRARLRDVDAPILVVVGGVTGAGKSTLVNTLLGEAAVQTGVLRPTTTGPTLVCHPGELHWFSTPRVLPALPRTTGRAEAGALRLLEHPRVPAGLALVDAPDVDSVNDSNRALADQLLEAADLWLWATTVGKYADERSMAYVRRAATRGTAMAVVLTQAQPRDREDVLADLHSKLGAEGAGDVEVLEVGWSPVADGRLPDEVAERLRAWVATRADPATARATRLQTLRGAVAALPGDAEALAAAVDAQVTAASDLSAVVDGAYARARDDFEEAIDAGLPLRAEVVDRWDRFVGTGKLLKVAEAASGQARAWIRGLLVRGPVEDRALEREVRVEVAETVARTIAALGDLAAAGVRARWSADTAGRVLLDEAALLGHASADLPERADEAVRGWQDEVVELVASVGAQRRARARLLSSVVTAVGTGAVLTVFAHAGLTGAEAGIAAAAGAANQSLLVKLLGEANLRGLVASSREALLGRFDALADQEAERFRRPLEERTPPAEQAAELRRAAADLVGAGRHAGAGM